MFCTFSCLCLQPEPTIEGFPLLTATEIAGTTSQSDNTLCATFLLSSPSFNPPANVLLLLGKNISSDCLQEGFCASTTFQKKTEARHCYDSQVSQSHTPRTIRGAASPSSHEMNVKSSTSQALLGQQLCSISPAFTQTSRVPHLPSTPSPTPVVHSSLCSISSA